MTFNNRKEFKWIISAIKPERHSYQNEFKRRYWKSSFVKARVQCSFHHPYRGKQTTVFAAGNTNYWSISDTTIRLSQFVASSTWCELFGSWSFCWPLCYRVSYIQCPKIPLQARTGTVGRRVSRSTHARLANVQKVKHKISSSASNWLNCHFLWRQKLWASEIEEGRIILFSKSN